MTLFPRDGTAFFKSSYPTCADNAALTGGKPLSLSSPNEVKAQDDCDSIINSLCGVAAATAPNSNYDLTQSIGSCEGHMFVIWRPTAIQYDDCVAQFQSITEQCMLINPGFRNYASTGRQFGVRNVVYAGNPGVGTDTEPAPSLGSVRDSKSDASYMMGPSGVFGNVDGYYSASPDPNSPSQGFANP